MSLHRLLIFVVLIVGLMLSSCNISSNNQAGIKINANFTAAALAVEAKLTGKPLAPSLIATSPADDIPTLAPLPAEQTDALPLIEATATPAPSATLYATATNTPAPTQVCDSALFIADVNYPDGTIVKTNELFTKTWRFKNVGTCTWDSTYALVFDVGDQMSGPTSVPLTVTVAPGNEVELSVDLQAPAKSGSYRSFWRLRNPAGVMLPIIGGYKGKSFYVDIRVKENVNNDVIALPRVFSLSNVDFIVTHTGSCNAGIYHITAKLMGNAPGEVTYHWKRSDGTSTALSDGKVTFTAAGTQYATYDWPTGATGISVSLSILAPVQRDFGPALLNCVP